MKKLFLICLLNFFLIGTSYALIEVDITRGNLDPLPIAVSPLHVDVKSEENQEMRVKELGNNISAIIENYENKIFSCPLSNSLIYCIQDFAGIKKIGQKQKESIHNCSHPLQIFAHSVASAD